MDTTRVPGGVTFVVSADEARRDAVASWLGGAGYGVETYADGRGCEVGLSLTAPDVLVVEPDGLSGGPPLEARVSEFNRMLPIVAIGPAERARYFDVLPQPIRRNEVVSAVDRAARHHRLAVRVATLEREVTGEGFPGIIGISDAIRHLNAEIERLAATDVSVCVRGESGTGKELVARAIHNHSGRSRGPFVAVNCGAIPQTLQESELFGHEKGAFTGATARRAGRFEQADGGTLLLDEVAELSLSAQAQLLRVIQERAFTRVGGSQEIRSDFRLLAATHKDLRAEVEAGRFRQDLFYRIMVYELSVPALRARVGDVEILARHFAHEYGQGIVGAVPALSTEALHALAAYDWPGNVRELQNAIQHALVSARGGRVGAQDLPAHVRSRFDTVQASVPIEVSTEPGFLVTPEMTLAEVERRTIELALQASGGNRQQAARQLGVGRTTLYRKLQEYEDG